MFKKTFALAAAVVTLFTASVASADDAKPAAPANQDKPAAQPSAPEHKTASTVQIQGTAGATTGGLGLGAGVRVGYTLPQKLYLGAALKFNYTSDEVKDVKVSATFYRPGVDFGYDVSTGPAVIRPYVGAGVAVQRVDVSTESLQYFETAATPAAWGGIQILGEIPKTPVLVGADVSTFVVATDTSAHPIDANLVLAARF